MQTQSTNSRCTPSCEDPVHTLSLHSELYRRSSLIPLTIKRIGSISDSPCGGRVRISTGHWQLWLEFYVVFLKLGHDHIPPSFSSNSLSSDFRCYTERINDSVLQQNTYNQLFHNIPIGIFQPYNDFEMFLSDFPQNLLSIKCYVVKLLPYMAQRRAVITHINSSVNMVVCLFVFLCPVVQ